MGNCSICITWSLEPRLLQSLLELQNAADTYVHTDLEAKLQIIGSFTCSTKKLALHKASSKPAPQHCPLSIKANNMPLKNMDCIHVLAATTY